MRDIEIRSDVDMRAVNAAIDESNGWAPPPGTELPGRGCRNRIRYPLEKAERLRRAEDRGRLAWRQAGVLKQIAGVDALFWRHPLHADVLIHAGHALDLGRACGETGIVGGSDRDADLRQAGRYRASGGTYRGREVGGEGRSGEVDHVRFRGDSGRAELRSYTVRRIRSGYRLVGWRHGRVRDARRDADRPRDRGGSHDEFPHCCAPEAFWIGRCLGLVNLSLVCSVRKLTGAPRSCIASVDSRPNVAITRVQIDGCRGARRRIGAHRSHPRIHAARPLAIRRGKGADAVARAVALSGLPPARWRRRPARPRSRGSFSHERHARLRVDPRPATHPPGQRDAADPHLVRDRRARGELPGRPPRESRREGNRPANTRLTAPRHAYALSHLLRRLPWHDRTG